MKFYIARIVLWLHNGKKRELKFLPNKINVIRGDSGTGKTEILEIVDYCLFASKSKIAESVVNENVSWYGIVLSINDSLVTIARSALEDGKVSDKYFFSSVGEIPDRLHANNSEGVIKSILESVFSIDSKVAIPYGSSFMKTGTKISFRYFLMFNTISVNIIESDNGVFFDKQDQHRYRDALPRIFDIALGIETVENILKKEKKEELEASLKHLLIKADSVNKNEWDFKEELNLIINEAKSFSMIPADLDYESSISALKSVVSELVIDQGEVETSDNIDGQIYLNERKVANLKAFSRTFDSYQSSQNKIQDSLKPIEFLKSRDSELIKTSIYQELVDALAKDLDLIKKQNIGKAPVGRQVKDEIERLESDVLRLKEIKSRQPDLYHSFESEKSKYIFLGQLKAKFELYGHPKSKPASYDSQIQKLQSDIESLVVSDNSEKRELTLGLAEDIITGFMTSVKEALDNYADYAPIINYKDKSLQFRKKMTSHTENVGSSSNHVFMQLFFTLAMHESAFKNKSPFMAPFLIIDQPSRPYWGGEGKTSNNDNLKVINILKLLSEFVEARIQNSGEFQMILFEHIPTAMFEKYKNFHLVEEFDKGGNALIPHDLI